MHTFFKKGKKLILEPQSTVLSAALVIMLMIVFSQVLGVVRQRVLLHYFIPEEYALFLAAFRLPDLVFEVFAFGAFSSAFIPVFTKSFNTNESEAWDIAGRVINIGLIIFLVMAGIFGFGAEIFYDIFAPGFTGEEVARIASIARVLFAAQSLFIVSYVLTGVLESLRHFFIPALAPLLYNIGIIVGTMLFADSLGIYAPAAGVVLGAFLHLTIQLPLAIRLGFRPSRKVGLTPGVKTVARLASPRVLELAILQIQKTIELFFASVISTASLTYLYLANSLQAMPISLFGVSLAKAALPALARLDGEDSKEAFKKTFLNTLYQMMFFVIPVTTLLIVLRVPLVRLLYGTDIFDWEATIQTGLVLSSFAIGIPFQAALTLLSRAFYAYHDTKTPVATSILDVILTILFMAIFVTVFHFGVWSIALANSFAVIIQVGILYWRLGKKLNGYLPLLPVVKSVSASVAAGTVMYIFLKFFDRSAWVKRLSFINSIDALESLDFQRFVLDTRYTVNLIILTCVTTILGVFVYVVVSALLRSNELQVFLSILRYRAFRRPQKDGEALTTTPSESGIST